MTNPMEQLLRSAIGYEALFNRPAAANYPPHNIEKLTEDHYRLTLAVAGFSQEELSISLYKGILTIEGHHETTVADDSHYLYRGIALRDFKREFSLGGNVEVIEASTEDGLLVIDLMREVPESEKPRIIHIT